MAKNTKELKEALERVGGLSSPSKMPCYGYSIPASACKLGSVLATVKGSTCFSCYAKKGRYVMPNVKNALERRLKALEMPTWVEDMTKVIEWKEKSGFFRWHDSGDLQSVRHLEQIVAICKNLPHIKFWLPTREFAVVKEYLKTNGSFPENLTVRLSATRIDTVIDGMGLPTSGVASNPTEVSCPAPGQGNECVDCRKCWDSGVKNVNYKKH